MELNASAVVLYTVFYFDVSSNAIQNAGLIGLYYPIMDSAPNIIVMPMIAINRQSGENFLKAFAKGEQIIVSIQSLGDSLYFKVITLLRQK